MEWSQKFCKFSAFSLFQKCSRSLEQFFLTVGQNNFVNKILTSIAISNLFRKSPEQVRNPAESTSEFWKYVLILSTMSLQYISGDYTTLCASTWKNAFALEWFMIRYKNVGILPDWFFVAILIIEYSSNIVIWLGKISRSFMAFFKISCWNTLCM